METSFKEKKKLSLKIFLRDVRHEIESLRKNATEQEKDNLDFRTFYPNNFENCIYGQMTGDCRSPRAKELMDKSCVRVMDIELFGNVYGSNYEDKAFNVNGKYKSEKSWVDDDTEYYNRNRQMNYLSVLEGYILLKNAKSENILAYIKGQINNLEL